MDGKVIAKDAGTITSYGYALDGGLDPTVSEQEYAELMASIATVAQQAAESATNAGQSAQSASQSATDAETAKGTAQQAATDAQSAQASAQGYAQSAQQSAQSASQSAQSAESAKNTAVNAVDGFAAGAQQALDSVNSAGNNWKSLAQAQALDSEAWAVGTRGGEDVGAQDATYHNNAKYYASQLDTAVETATGAAQTATIKASEASASASAAAESARTLTIDPTLTQAGQAAGAKETGDAINEVKADLSSVESEVFTDTPFTISDAGTLGYRVSSEDGSLISSASSKYIILDLTEEHYHTLTFGTTAYGANSGYGFILSDNTWSGVHTTVNETVTITVPEGAKTFKASWNKDNLPSQTISGVKRYATSDSIYTNIDRRFTITESVPILAYNASAISSDTGELVASISSSCVVVDIEDKGYKTLTFKSTQYGANYGYGFVLSDDTWSGVKTTQNTTLTVDVPEGAKTFKMSWNHDNEQNQSISCTRVIDAQDIYSMFDVTDKGGYPVNIDTSLSAIGNVPIVIASYSDVQSEIYDKYDALVSECPDWVTKIDTAEAGYTVPSYLENLPIYLYKFSAKRTNITDPASHLKVMITTGTHPNEAMGIFNVFHFFKYINDNWRTNDACYTLRTMVDFYVIPCVSPWGYTHTTSDVYHGRCNGNGVNLNRNFPTHDWVSEGSGTNDYSGASAGSEYETKIVMYYANLYRPHVYFDAHTGGMPNGRYGCINMDVNAKQQMLDTGMAYGMHILRDWVVNNSDFPQYIDGNPLMNVGKSALSGLTYRWFNENITPYAFLTEESIDNYWVNGVLTTSNPERNTQRIFNENFRAVYDVIVHAINSASRQFYKL